MNLIKSKYRKGYGISFAERKKGDQLAALTMNFTDRLPTGINADK